MIMGIAAGFKNMFYFLKRTGIFKKDDEKIEFYHKILNIFVDFFCDIVYSMQCICRKGFLGKYDFGLFNKHFQFCRVS